jgi:hypothetical protein
MRTNQPNALPLPTSDRGAIRKPELAAVRLVFSSFELRRSATADHYERAAKTFAANPRALQLGKILLDPGHPALWAVFAVRRRIMGYWKGITLPATGATDVRLLRRSDVDAFVVQMASLQAELDDALAFLGACYEELQEHARTQLGDLYEPSDYPRSLSPHFGVCWDWPQMPMPGYLQRIALPTPDDVPAPAEPLGDDDISW